MTTTFETGTKSAQANNLVLSVMSDGAIYQDRLHVGYAMLQGASHRGLTFRDIVMSEANKQRVMGVTFKAAAISDAAQLVRDRTIEQCLELVRDAWNGEKIVCCGRQWSDKINGNTYFSARIVVPTESGSRVLCIPFQYGYGDQWQWECLYALNRASFSLGDRGYLSDKPLQFVFEGLMRKRDMYEGIYF